ncbi:MAG TPA: hypothetical protein VM307_05110 [Egibacteraceae bacterium]|nr:hypothetical protein [Egibacteraceae bacterium]
MQVTPTAPACAIGDDTVPSLACAEFCPTAHVPTATVTGNTTVIELAPVPPADAGRSNTPTVHVTVVVPEQLTPAGVDDADAESAVNPAGNVSVIVTGPDAAVPVFDTTNR